MTLELKRAKVVKSNHLTTSLPTQGSKLKFTGQAPDGTIIGTAFGEGRRLAIRDKNTNVGKSARIKRVAGRRAGTSVQLSTKPRTIIP